MAEYIESVCRSCFHSYVCEQFNEHRDSNNERCHFFNDHFVPVADVVPVVRCKDCKHRFEDLKPEFAKGSGICMKLYDTGKIEGYLCRVNADDFCSYGERKEADGNG